MRRPALPPHRASGEVHRGARRRRRSPRRRHGPRPGGEVDRLRRVARTAPPARRAHRPRRGPRGGDQPMQRARHALIGVMIVMLAFAGAACSDDDEPSDTGSSADTTAGDTADGGEGEGGDAELVAFCDAFAEVNSAFQGEEPPPAAEGEALLAELEETTPEEVAGPVET